MTHSIAIIAPGRMGSALAAILVRSGHRVVTLLDGRSAVSHARAEAAGMIPVPRAALGNCDMILSVAPPAEAGALARDLAPLLAAAERKPLFVDMNAVSPGTVAEIAGIIGGTGCGFVDGCIIGTVPRADYDGPFLYLSGAEAGRASTILGDCGLWLQVIDAPVGAASALKMCFAGIMKGITSLGISMLLAADRVGAGPVMARELERSQPELWAWFCRQIPASHVKHGRWVAEMEEISTFLAISGDPEAAAQFKAVAGGFARLAEAPATAAPLKTYFGADG